MSVLLGDSDIQYTAGERDLAELDGEGPDSFPAWPSGGLVIRARPWGTPRDGSVQEVDWRLQAEATDVPEPTPRLLAELQAALEANGSLHGIELTPLGRKRGIGRYVRGLRPCWGIRVAGSVRATRSFDALVEADRVITQALTELLPTKKEACVSTQCLGPSDGGGDAQVTALGG